jgi:plasmid replication initiation protein
MKPEDSPLITQDNRVVEAAYKLTLAEKRLVLLVLTKIDSHPDKPAALPETLIEVCADDVVAHFPLPQKKAYEMLKDAADKLYERTVYIDGARDRTRWVSRVTYLPNEGRVVLRLAVDILPYLTQLMGAFTQYRLLRVADMSSVYAIRLYELLVQWTRAGKRDVEVDWIKQQFEIADQYENIRDLKRRVIDPAVAQVNKHSDLDVTYTQRKRGREVVAFVFKFGLKQEATPAAVVDKAPALPKRQPVEPAVQPPAFVPTKPQQRTAEQRAKAREALAEAKEAARGRLSVIGPRTPRA